MDGLEDDALAIEIQAGAVRVCRFHPHVWVSEGDPDAEAEPMPLAQTKVKSGEIVADREDLMSAINNAIIWSAEDECPDCARYRDA